MSILNVLSVNIKGETDVVAARQRARQIATMSGFATQDQARIATVVSEIVRNLVRFPGGGKIDFAVDLNPQAQQLIISIQDRRASDRPDDYASMLSAARRLMDSCERTVDEAGTTVVLGKLLPQDAQRLTPDTTRAFSLQLGHLPDNVAIVEVRQQNDDLLEAMQIGQARLEQLQQAKHELELTNLRIVALNEQLDEKAASLQRADMYKDEFLAILSHELRGPLAAARMAAHLLVTPPSQDARAIQLGHLISRQTTQMSRMVEDLLDISRVSRGMVRLDKQKIDLRQVIRDAIEQVDSLRMAKGHDISVSLPEHPCWVDGDHSRLVQAISNLLGNAIRYTGDGGEIAVTVDIPGTDVRVRVTDNGIGLDPDKIPRLFDIYVQAERSSDRGRGGLGLGLALVKSLVELHGGSVSASSAGIGCGSSFWLRLPLS